MTTRPSAWEAFGKISVYHHSCCGDCSKVHASPPPPIIPQISFKNKPKEESGWLARRPLANLLRAVIPNRKQATDLSSQSCTQGEAGNSARFQGSAATGSGGVLGTSPPSSLLSLQSCLYLWVGVFLVDWKAPAGWLLGGGQTA